MIVAPKSQEDSIVFTFVNAALGYSSAILWYTGAIILHGGHHVAVKSTTTSLFFPALLRMDLNWVISETSVTDLEAPERILAMMSSDPGMEARTSLRTRDMRE